MDGGIVNTMPIDKVIRHENDILVAFDVNDIDVEGIRATIIQEAREEEAKVAEDKALSLETRTVMNAIRNNASLTFMDKLKLAGAQGQKVIRHKLQSSDPEPELDFEDNYYSILSRTFSIMNHALSKLAADIHKPDILVKMPFDTYGEIGDYSKAREISEAGRELMRAALDRFENN